MRNNSIFYNACLFFVLINGFAFASEKKEIKIPVFGDQVTVIASLPAEIKGSDVSKNPTFNTSIKKTENNAVILNVTSEPVYIIEGKLPETANLKPQDSPFGFLPANVNDTDYSYALDIGVVWERGGIFPFLWSVVQPDPKSPVYNWEPYDRYFKNLPEGIREVKNISVTRFLSGGMMRPPPQDESRDRFFARDGRRPPGGRDQRNPAQDSRDMQQSRFSQAHVEGDTYRPSNIDMYLRWVKATVERYDGDGKDDMPGLNNPVKYWQIDNEPETLRPGYADLVRMTSQAIKEADPNAKVILGGLFLPILGAEKRYESKQLPLLEGLNNYIDIIDLHWFGRSGEWQEFSASLNRTKRDLKHYGLNNKPIYMTEVGTYSGSPSGRREVSNPLQSEHDQADEMLKRYVVALNEGVERVFWAFGMMEGFANPNDNDFFDNTGVLYDGIGPNDPGKGVKKISYWTYKKMTDMLKFWDGSLPERMDVSKDIHAYRFKFHNNENRGIVVIWAD